MKESFCVWARDIRVASVRSTTPFESSPPFSRRYQPAQKPSPLKTFLASNIPGSYANSCLGFRPRIKDICQNSCFMTYIYSIYSIFRGDNMSSVLAKDITAQVLFGQHPFCMNLNGSAFLLKSNLMPGLHSCTSPAMLGHSLCKKPFPPVCLEWRRMD